MDLDNVFATDQSKELQGVWTEITFRGQTGKFLIARAGNEKFSRMFAGLIGQKPFTDQTSNEAKAYHEASLIKAMAATILLDTGDEITVKGEPLKYTPEIGEQVLTAYSELRNQVSMVAGDFENFAAFNIESLIKN